MLAALVVGLVVARGRPRAGRRAARRRRSRRPGPGRTAAPAAGSWCAGSGRGTTCRARPAPRARAAFTNSSTSGASSKCTDLARRPCRELARAAPAAARASSAALPLLVERARHGTAERRLRPVRRQVVAPPSARSRSVVVVARSRAVAPGEQAVARRARRPRARGSACASAPSFSAEVEARPLPRQPADLAAEDLARQRLGVARRRRSRSRRRGACGRRARRGMKACSGVSIEAARGLRSKVQCGR